VPFSCSLGTSFGFAFGSSWSTFGRSGSGCSVSGKSEAAVGVDEAGVNRATGHPRFRGHFHGGADIGNQAVADEHRPFFDDLAGRGDHPRIRQRVNAGIVFADAVDRCRGDLRNGGRCGQEEEQNGTHFGNATEVSAADNGNAAPHLRRLRRGLRAYRLWL
jgi:hypothetical protein